MSSSELWMITEWTTVGTEPKILEMLDINALIHYELSVSQENTVVISDNNEVSPRVGIVLYIAANKNIIERKLESLKSTRRTEQITQIYDALREVVTQMSPNIVDIENDVAEGMGVPSVTNFNRFMIPVPETDLEFELNSWLERNLAHNSNTTHNSNPAHNNRPAQNSNVENYSDPEQNSNLANTTDPSQNSNFADNFNLEHSINLVQNSDLDVPDNPPMASSTPLPNINDRMSETEELCCNKSSQTDLHKISELCEEYLNKLLELKESFGSAKSSVPETTDPSSEMIFDRNKTILNYEYTTIDFTVSDTVDESAPENINHLTRTIRQNDVAVPSGIITLNDVLPPITSLSEISIAISDSEDIGPLPLYSYINSRLPETEQTITGIELAEQNDMDLVPIGDGNVKLQRWLLETVDWSCYTTATRQLLRATFSRRILATHRIPGIKKFENGSKTKTFDPKLIEDIIKTVSINCDVAETLVRNTIIIICAAEAKTFRKQCKEQRRRISMSNNESSPSSSS